MGKYFSFLIFFYNLGPVRPYVHLLISHSFLEFKPKTPGENDTLLYRDSISFTFKYTQRYFIGAPRYFLTLASLNYGSCLILMNDALYSWLFNL